MIYLSFGRREQGKTTLVYHMAHRFPSRIVFDPRGMIDRPGALRIREIDDLAPAFDELYYLRESEVIFAPVEDDINAAFSAFSAQLKRFVLDKPAGRRVAIVVDESSFVDLMNGSFQTILRCSSRQTVHTMITTHRPIDVPVTVRAIADHWLIFPVRQEHDLRVIAERCSPETADLVTTLKAREFAHWNDEDASLVAMRNPDRWYMPLETVEESLADAG